MSILDELVAVKKKEVDRLKKELSLSELQKRVKGLARGLDFPQALRSDPCAVIAEVKRHSPSKGTLREDINPVALALLYEKNGASAISVLTDRQFFHGSSACLAEIKETVNIPVLRKDFLIDPYQIYETKMLRADALLLIAGLLPEERLREFIGLSRSLGLWPLVEVHTREDLSSALLAGAEIIGINNRDLNTFTTDIQRTIDLAPFVPQTKMVVSESGINGREDIEVLMKAGIHAFLVGEALVRASSPGQKLHELRGKGKLP